VGEKIREGIAKIFTVKETREAAAAAE